MTGAPQIRMVAPGDLRPHPRNPRVHPDSAVEKLTRSIGEFGWTVPVIVSADGLILAGHARVKAALKAGIAQVPVIEVPLSGERAVAYMIADNRLPEETGWDEAALAGLLDELRAVNVDLALTGLDARELERLMEHAAPIELDGGESSDSGDQPAVYHCPKCGFVFEVPG